MRDPNRVVGKCYQCRRRVQSYEAARVQDATVTLQVGRPIRRLAHRGACEDELRYRLGGGIGA